MIVFPLMEPSQTMSLHVPDVGSSGTQLLRIKSSISVFTAELHGLLLAIRVVSKEKLRKSISYTGYLSELKDLTFVKNRRNILVTQLLPNVHTANENGLELVFS